MSTEPTASDTNVLIVDDDPDISQALTDLLEHEGYRVRVAVNGAEALEKAKQARYGAVLLDLGLPDMDGLELLRSLQEVDATLPIIVLTAYTTAEKTVGSLSKGAFAFLTKPYNRDQLKATLSRAVGVKALATRAETVESALTVSEDRFRSVVQSASDAIVLANAQGQVISWNKAAERLFGYAEMEVLGKALTTLMPPRYRQAHQRGLERVRATGQSQVIGQTLQLEGLRKDGSEFPIELSLATWRTHSETYYCGIIRDVTERRRTEAALQASEERYRALFEDNPSMYFMVDHTARILSVNRFGAEQLGYTVAELVGRPVLNVFYEADREAVTRNFKACLAQVGHTMNWEFRKVRKDGSLLRVREAARAVSSEGKSPVVLIVCEDITEQKRAEEALQLVVEGSASLMGREFFRSLVRQLATALEVRFALATMCKGSPATKVQTLSVWMGDTFADNFDYDLEGTPCHGVVGGELAYYAKDIQQLFPRDEVLVKMRAESYLGIPFVNSTGAVIGHLAVMDDKPMGDEDRKKAILRIFAARAGAELERMQTEVALRASEERLDLAVRGSNDGLWDARPLQTEPWSSPKTPTWYSPRFKEMLGFAPEEFPDVLESWLLQLHPDDKDRVFAALTAHIERKAPLDAEYRLRTKPGDYRWFRARGQAIWDDAGTVVRMAGSLQCIDDQKRAEEALREQLRLATFGSELGIVLTRSRTLRDMLGLCTEAMVHHLDAAFARVWLLNQQGTGLELQASSGMYTHLDGPHSRVPVGSLKVGRIAQTRQPHLTNDVLHDQQISDQEWARREGMVAFAGYPLMVEDRLIGVVAVFARQPLTGYTIKALAAAANAIAGGIERKQGEEALARLSHQHDLILNSAGEGIFGLDRHGHTTFVNVAGARMLGWDANELIGNSMHSFIHHSKPDGSPYPEEQCPIYAAMRDGSVHAVYNEVFWKKDGASFPVEYLSTPIRESGELTGAVIVFKDISDRKLTEEALRESEELLRQVTENIKEVFWISDPEKTRILYISSAYEEIWGRSCHSLRASPRSWLDAIHPDDRARVLDAALTKQVSGRYNEEYRIVRPDGSIRWIHDRAFPVRDASGRVYRIAGIAEDMTSRKQDNQS